ncbi:hypothetical protein ABZP36_022697 [Zizania latifolia]
METREGGTRVVRMLLQLGPHHLGDSTGVEWGSGDDTGRSRVARGTTTVASPDRTGRAGEAEQQGGGDGNAGWSRAARGAAAVVNPSVALAVERLTPMIPSLVQ